MEIINIHGGDQSSLSVIQPLILSTSFNELSVFWIFCIIKKCGKTRLFEAEMGKNVFLENFILTVNGEIRVGGG